MTFYIYSPHWFLGIDSLLEFFTILISIAISIYSFKIYRTFKHNRYKYFSLSFALMALAFIFKIISNLIFIVSEKNQLTGPLFTYIYTTYDKIMIIDQVSFLLHKVTLIFALLVFFFLINKEKKVSTMILILVFGTIIAVLAESYLLFNFLIILILLLLFLINHYENDKVKKNHEFSNLSKFFLGLAISFFFIFLGVINDDFYSLGELGFFLSFIFLFYQFYKVFK